MPKFFIGDENIGDGTIEILGDDARHIARSLRMAVGDEITVSNGRGTLFFCRLTLIRDERCECEIISQETENIATRVTLFMAYPKGDKLETIVQKAVELGACRIVPFTSSRCIKHPRAEREAKQTERLLRIAVEAAKQCGAATLPEISSALSFDEMLKEAKASELALFCYENEKARMLKDTLSAGVGSISVIVGSEGGFSPEEAQKAEVAGLIPVSLGRRILRCETAPLYALSVICALLEL